MSDLKEKDNANIRAAFIHILGDIVQSVGVVIASIIIKIKPTWIIVDPICTFMFAFIVSCTTISVIRTCLRVLMEGTPETLDITRFNDDLKAITGVRNVHDCHVWSLTHGKPTMCVHLEGDDVDYILKKATIICRKFGIYHSTIQVDSERQKDEGGKFYVNCDHNLY